jgi:penicillin V acylase-like amidase (Ntn superfamily)
MCTNITIKSKDNNVIVGRSMEFAVNLESEIFFRAKGYEYNQNSFLNEIKALLIDLYEKVDQPELDAPKVTVNDIDETLLHKWKGDYSFVGLNGLGIDAATHGMNSEGLVTGDMVLTQSIYQSFNENDAGNLIVFPYLTNWILSTCATCHDVKDNLKKFCIINPFDNIPPAFHFHFPVNDAYGNAIVIEYVNGELQIHDNFIGVLTNDPLFPWQRENLLNNYTNISPVNFPNKKTGENSTVIRPKGNIFEANTLGQGTGFIGLPGSSTPPDRFVKAAMMSNYIYQPSSAEEAINIATHIMNTVDIPRGTSREYIDSTAEEAESDFTLWVTISDTKNLQYYIRSYGSPLMYLVDFKAILTDYESNLEELNGLKINIPTGDLAININEQIYKPELIC